MLGQKWNMCVLFLRCVRVYDVVLGFVRLACGSLSDGKFWPSSLLALNSLDFGSEISE